MDIGVEMKKIMKESIIRFLKSIKTDDKEKMNNVINFLERGWNYEDMWEFLEEYLNPGGVMEFSGDIEKFNPIEHIRHVMKDLKKEYFPSPKPKDTPDRYILNKIEEVIRNFLNDIYQIKSEREVRERNKKGGLSC